MDDRTRHLTEWMLLSFAIAVGLGVVGDHWIFHRSWGDAVALWAIWAAGWGPMLGLLLFFRHRRQRARDDT